MKKMNPSQLVRTLSLGLSVTGILWLILGALPLTDNFLVHSKHFGLFVMAILFVLLFMSLSLIRKKMELATTPLLLPLMIFGGVTLASTLFTQPYPIEALLGMGGVYLASVLIAIFGGSLLPKKSDYALISGLAVAAVLVTILSIAQLVGFGPSHLLNSIFNIDLIHTLAFVLTGSVLIALQLLLAALVGIGFVTYKSKKITKLHAFLIPVLLIGVGLFIWAMLPGNQSSLVLPNPLASWSVALDSIRSPRAAILGNGPESYVNAYRSFKPLWINDQANWDIDFSSASNTPLTLLSTMGFAGVLAWLFLAYRVLIAFKKGEVATKPLAVVILFLFLTQLFLPANAVVVGVIALLMTGLIAGNRDAHASVEFKALAFHLHPPKSRVTLPSFSKEPAPILMYLNLILLTVMVGVLGYTTLRAYYAHNLSLQANQAATNNDGIALYTLRQRAVAANPYLDSLRRDYAIANLLVASALANKTDITDQEKEQVSALLQQAVQEARAATVLDPDDSLNWQVLAQVYQNLIGVAEDAENWTVQAYVRAIETNPTNPALRIALANVFMNQDQNQQAIGILQQAAQIKNNFPNTFYNLAVALQRSGDLVAAKQAFQAVLALLPEQSEDYNLVTKALEELEVEIAKMPAASPTPSTNRTETNPQPNVPSITDQTINQPGESPLSPELAPVTLPESSSETIQTETSPTPTGTAPVDSP